MWLPINPRGSLLAWATWRCLQRGLRGDSLLCWCEAHKAKPHLRDSFCFEWWWKNGED